MADSTSTPSSEWTFIKKTKKKVKKNKADIGLFKTIKKNEEFEILIRNDNKGVYYSLNDLIRDRMIDYYIISGREQNEFKKENASELNRYVQKHLEYFFKKPLSKDQELKSCVFKNIKEEFSDDEYDNYPYVLVCQQPLIGKRCRNSTKTMKYKDGNIDYCYKKNRGRLTICLHADIRIYKDNSIIFAPFSLEGASKKTPFKYSEADFPDEIKSSDVTSGPSWAEKIKVSKQMDKEKHEAKVKEEAEKKALAETKSPKNDQNNDEPITEIEKPVYPSLVVEDIIPEDEKNDEQEEEEAKVISNRTIRDFENRFNDLEKQIRGMNQFILQQQNKESHMERHMEMISKFMKMMNRIQTSVRSSL